MIYDYECTKCGDIHEEEHSMNGFKEFEPVCPECGSTCKYRFTATIIQVALKDGPSGSWPSKGERIKKQRAAASANAARRQRDHIGEGKKLIPNYNGKETGSWAEAQFQAFKERGSESAATYNSKVAKEKSDSKLIK